MKKLLIIMVVLSLCSCNVMNKIVGTEYWDEVCIEKYARYDSSNLKPKRFCSGQKVSVYMTDSTDTQQYNIIWGDKCEFTPGEQLYVQSVRAHSPSSGSGGWKSYLINHKEKLSYILYD